MFAASVDGALIVSVAGKDVPLAGVTVRPLLLVTLQVIGLLRFDETVTFWDEPPAAKLKVEDDGLIVNSSSAVTVMLRVTAELALLAS